jgi:RHS repeat-associated protein
MTDPVQTAASAPSPLVNTYDERGRVLSQTDQLDRTTTFDYDVIGDGVLVEDPEGNLSARHYLGGLPSLRVDGYRTPAETSARVYYDATVGRPNAIRDVAGNWVTATYNELANQTSFTDEIGRRTTSTYNGDGQPLTLVTAAGNSPGATAAEHTTTWTYDALGSVSTVVTPLAGPSPDARIVTFNHDDMDHPTDTTSVVDTRGRTTTLTYDEDGNIATVTDPENNTASYDWDGLGRLLSSVDPRGHAAGNDPEDFTTSYTYNTRNLRLTTTDALGEVTTFAYDANGNLRTSQDANSDTTTFTYDAENQAVRVDRSNTTSLHTAYNGNGQVEVQTDGAGEATTYSYDPIGRLATTTDPLDRTTTYTYDALGNRTSVENPGGDCAATTPTGCTEYEHDAAGQLTSILYSDPATPDITGMVYDPMGRATTITDAEGTLTRTFDSFGQLRTSNDGNGTVSYDYDLAGHIEEIAYPAAGTVEREYDDAGRMTSSTDWDSHETTFVYDEASHVTEIHYPDAGQIDTFAYDRVGRLASQDFVAGSTINATIDPDYDATGQLIQEIETGLPGPGTTTWGYDELGRPTHHNAVETWGYDEADNLALLNGTTQAYDAANQVCRSGTGSGDCTTGMTSPAVYTHDERGNLTQYDPTFGFTVDFDFDQAERLTEMTIVGVGSIEHSYAPDGLRSELNNGGDSRSFHWDRSSALPQLLAETTTSGTIRYLYGPDGLAYAQVNPGGSTTYLHRDQLGSTRLLTDESGAVTGAASYDAFGTPVTIGTQSQLGYAGQYTDPSTGLVYMRARFYSPAFGQFLTRDPRQAQTRQPYAYAANNPLNRTDPSGLDPGVVPQAPGNNEDCGALRQPACYGSGAPLSLPPGMYDEPQPTYGPGWGQEGFTGDPGTGAIGQTYPPVTSANNNTTGYGAIQICFAYCITITATSQGIAIGYGMGTPGASVGFGIVDDACSIAGGGMSVSGSNWQTFGIGPDVGNGSAGISAGTPGAGFDFGNTEWILGGPDRCSC